MLEEEQGMTKTVFLSPVESNNTDVITVHNTNDKVKHVVLVSTLCEV